MRRVSLLLAAPSVYPYQKPFYDTPFDQDRSVTRSGLTHMEQPKKQAPSWMSNGIDGTGRGIGLYRRHPLSKDTAGNFSRGKQDIPRIFSMMTQGSFHRSGITHYFKGGKPPNPSKHPYLTGTPHPLYGWKVTEPQFVREFNTPHVSKEQIRYKPYVALHERGILGNIVEAKTAQPAQEKAAKPLLKRLFFWQ